MITQLKNKKMRRLGVVAAFLGLGLVSYTASADILLARQNTNIQLFGAAATLDLDVAAGNQAVVNFSTSTANTLVRVIFNAEGTIAGGPGNWLDSTIFIDPAGAIGLVACTPSNSNNAFVSGAGAATRDDGWISAVTQCFYRIPTAGVHAVRVVMTPHPAALWRIQDLSIVIDSE